MKNLTVKARTRAVLGAALLALPGMLSAAQQAPAAVPATPAQAPGQAPAQEPAQVPGQAEGRAANRPLPEIKGLMQQVEAHQYAAEAAEKDYIYRVANAFDEVDGSGAVKKTKSQEYEVFWLNGVRVARLLKKDGKELSATEKAREDERIDKEVAKAKERRDKAESQGHETDAGGHDEISFARMLQLGTFSNARRISVRGRDTILVDFTGDPKAKSHNASEAAFKDLTGTVAVDEQDKAIQHVEGHFMEAFKLGGGLLVNVRKDTRFVADFAKVNDEVWLPETVAGNGHARIMLFFVMDGNFHGRSSDFRKFKAKSTILPMVTPVDPTTQTQPAPSAPTSKPVAPGPSR